MATGQNPQLGPIGGAGASFFLYFMFSGWLAAARNWLLQASQKPNPLDGIPRSQPSPSSSLLQPAHKACKSAFYHIYTLWLFLASDTKTIVPIWVGFGLAHAASLSRFGHESIPPTTLLPRAPLVLLWVLLNLLPGCISNQSRPSSIVEDSINKPWRPIPSQRISVAAAAKLRTICDHLSLAFSLAFGGLGGHVTLQILWRCYDDLGAANDNPCVRNIVNGLGITAFGYGALETAVGTSPLARPLASWLCTLILAIASTIHIQDLKDRAGDAAAGRCSVPVVYGDTIARYSLALALPISTIACCGIWAKTWFAWFTPAALWPVIVYRVLRKRGVEEDKRTYALWILWLLGIYLIPVF